MQERGYQIKADANIRAAFKRVKRVLYVGACGSGKTVIFTKIAEGANRKRKSVNIMAHRKELIFQCSNKLKYFGVDHGIIKSGVKPEYEKPIQVSSVQTLVHHLDEVKPDMLIADEAHHSQNATQQKIISAYPAAILLGVTASPIFGNGRSMGGYYDEMVIGPTVAELVEDGYLVRTRVFAPPVVADINGIDYDSLTELEQAMNKRKVTGDAIEHYRRICPGAAAIAYVVNIKHGQDVAIQFRESGFKFYAIDGTMDDHERDGLLRDFASGAIEGLVSCDLISEGTDIPRAVVAIKLRPTKSLGLNIQQDGRVNRPYYAPGFDLNERAGRLAAIAASEKPYSYIIDHVNNLFFHGYPDDIIEWSLTAAPIISRQGGRLEPIQQCQKCYLHFSPSPACPYCGHAAEKKERKLTYTQGQLVEMKKDEMATKKKLAEELKKAKIRERKAAKTIPELIEFARKYDYENPEAWARKWQQMRSRHR